MIAAAQFRAIRNRGNISMKLTLFAACGVAACCVSTAALAQTAPAPAAAAQTAPAADTAAAPAAAPVVAQPQPQVGPGSTLPSNTDIWVAIDHRLDSHGVKLGDPLTFKVARDVMIGNYIVIPRGTPAAGRITKRSGRGAFGKSAKLEFDIDTISLSSRAIPVSGHFRIEGDGNTGATLGAVAAAGVIGGVFVKGHSAVAAEGSEYKVSTKEPVEVVGGTL
jgi:pyruvate/2-oxoglutarate dehydrogenase complex dihydrolipoamide acyltransferase (E2) component